MIEIREIENNSAQELNLIKTMFREYASSLNFELSFQNFNDELRKLPGEYVPPGGKLLLSFSDGQAAGCVALRRLDNQYCEMKRLYIRPAMRGNGIGKLLAQSVINEARLLGYLFLRLDTVDSMVEANRLYNSLGFYEIEPYRFNPIKGARYLELDITRLDGVDETLLSEINE